FKYGFGLLREGVVQYEEEKGEG
ncbi:MAG: hypothetical protein RL098_1606, partial [Bacteroidota bacterium]